MPQAIFTDPKPLDMTSASLAGLGGAFPPPWKEQRKSNWCWAAAAAMVDTKVPPASGRSQCAIAAQGLYDPEKKTDALNCTTANSISNIEQNISGVFAAIGTQDTAGSNYGESFEANWISIDSWLRDGNFCIFLFTIGSLAHYVTVFGVAGNDYIVYNSAEHVGEYKTMNRKMLQALGSIEAVYFV